MEKDKFLKFFVLFLIFLTVTNSIYAVEPEVFLRILNIDAENFSTQNDMFGKVKEVLGETKQFHHGESSESIGWVEYLSQDRSQMITFSSGECFSGYTVQVPKSKNKIKIMKLKVKKIEVGGLRLGMSEQESENIFSKMQLNDWKVKEKKEKTKWLYNYRKEVLVNNQKYCHHITINLKFDERDKLEKYDFNSSECEDAGCLE